MRGSHISLSSFSCGSSILVELEFGNVGFFRIACEQAPGEAEKIRRARKTIRRAKRAQRGGKAPGSRFAPGVLDHIRLDRPKTQPGACSQAISGGRKTGVREEKPSEEGENQQQTQPTYGTGPESNPGHIGGRRTLSPWRQPYSPNL